MQYFVFTAKRMGMIDGSHGIRFNSNDGHIKKLSSTESNMEEVNVQNVDNVVGLKETNKQTHKNRKKP